MFKTFVRPGIAREVATRSGPRWRSVDTLPAVAGTYNFGPNTKQYKISTVYIAIAWIGGGCVSHT
jgi:hypothetical protein